MFRECIFFPEVRRNGVVWSKCFALHLRLALMSTLRKRQQHLPFPHRSAPVRWNITSGESSATRCATRKHLTRSSTTEKDVYNVKTWTSINARNASGLSWRLLWEGSVSERGKWGQPSVSVDDDVPQWTQVGWISITLLSPSRK